MYINSYVKYNRTPTLRRDVSQKSCFSTYDSFQYLFYWNVKYIWTKQQTSSKFTWKHILVLTRLSCKRWISVNPCLHGPPSQGLECGPWSTSFTLPCPSAPTALSALPGLSAAAPLSQKCILSTSGMSATCILFSKMICISLWMDYGSWLLLVLFC